MVFWATIIAALPSLYVLARARRINHLVFFSAGYLYYWILPVLVGEYPSVGADSDVAFQKWADIFAALPTGRLVIFVASIVTFYSCFFVGDRLAEWGVRKRRVQLRASLQFIPILYCGMFAITAVFTYKIRWAIGSDYSAVQDVAIAKGTLTAMSLTLLGLALLRVMGRRPKTLRALLLNPWMMGYFLIAIALFGMGQRLYFVTSIFLLLSFRSLYIKEFTLAQIATGAITVSTIGAAMGLLRLRADVSMNALIQNLAYEPVFTSFSLVSFLQSNRVPWLEFPRFLMGDFLNLVPTAFLPNKADLLLDPLKAGFYFISPLGAMNSWVSFIINFGVAGTCLVMTLFGYFLRWLLMRSDTPLVRTQYLMCSSFMVFTFFRDPFSVSLVKNIFEFGLMMPLTFVLFSNSLVWCVRGKSVGSVDKSSSPVTVTEATAPPFIP